MPKIDRMKNIPHDYYLRFLDGSVYEDTLSFHTKGNYVIHDAFKRLTALHFLESKHLAAMTGNELRLYPDMDRCFPINAQIKTGGLIRSESCCSFSNTNLPFSLIEELITPLMPTSKGGYKRGYPSGGALYPIEVFVCSLMADNSTWPCPEKILHVLPNSADFEIMQNTECTDQLKEALLSAPGNIGSPSLAIVYAAYLPKMLFKYRYRGYRLALMEAGSLYMLIELQAKRLQLRTRLWSAYTDTMLCKAIGLNPALFLPLCVHFVGKTQ